MLLRDHLHDPPLLAMPATFVDEDSVCVLGGTLPGGKRPLLFRHDIGEDRWKNLSNR